MIMFFRPKYKPEVIDAAVSVTNIEQHLAKASTLSACYDVTDLIHAHAAIFGFSKETSRLYLAVNEKSNSMLPK